VVKSQNSRAEYLVVLMADFVDAPQRRTSLTAVRLICEMHELRVIVTMFMMSSSLSQDREWFRNPRGWLSKPDFKRSAQQRRATIDNSILKNFSVKSLFTKGYTRRWFVLNIETSILEYFESDNEGKSKHARLGMIDLSDVSGVDSPSNLHDAPPFSIDLLSQNQVYTLAADSAEIISNWTIVLTREIEKLRCQREIRANRVHNVALSQRTNAVSARSDFSPSELVHSIMSFCDPHRTQQYASPVLAAFYSKIVSMLLNPSERYAPIGELNEENVTSADVSCY
jgi:hypothetical protein